MFTFLAFSRTFLQVFFKPILQTIYKKRKKVKFFTSSQVSFSELCVYLVVLCITAAREEVEKEEDEGEDEPGGGHGPNDPQALQVHLRLRPKTENI